MPGMSENEINVCLACDDNYAYLCGATIASLLKNAAEDDVFNIYILDNNISPKNRYKILSLQYLQKSKISFIRIENKEFFDNLYLPEKKGYLSVSSYYRFMAQSLFKDLDRILYLDCDIIAISSIAEFYNTDFEDNYAVMIRDTACEDNKNRLNFLPDETYYNSGVILINLNKWREDNIEKKLFDNIKDGLDDQDIINIVLKNKIKEADDKWNYQKKAKKFGNELFPKIAHFITAYKPSFTGYKNSFNGQYWQAIKGTAFDSFYGQYFRRFCLNVKKQRNTIYISFWTIKTRIRL